MANEFYVRKGLAIATSSIATASGATQATKYLVVGDDSVIRWATASVTSGVSGTSGIDGTSGTSGSSGTSGTSGVSGTSGTSGSSGVQGESAGIPYNYITSGTLSDPGSGNLKFISSGFLSSVSQILVNHNDLNTNDNELFLESLSGGVLTLKSNLNSGTNFAVFTITSVTNFSTYVSFSVNISFTTGNWSFVSTDLVVLNFSKSGTSGTSGVNGTSGTSGTSGVSFVGSGTLNRVARWTPDGSTLGNSLMTDNGTLVELTGSSSDNYKGLFFIKNEISNPVNNNSLIGLRLDNRYLGNPATGLRIRGIELVTTNLLGGYSNIGIRNNVNGSFDLGGNHLKGISNFVGSNITNDEQTFGIFNQVGPSTGNTNTSQDAIGIYSRVMPNIGGGGTYLAQLRDGTEGIGKVLTCMTADGKANWATPSGIGGSGTNSYVARWTPDGSTLGNSLIQDDGTNIGVNYAPQSGVQLAVGNSVNPTSVYVLNSYATSSTTKGLQVLSIGTPTDGPRIGVDIYVSPSPSNYGLKINDGREGLGKVLTSDATGNAYWSNNIGTTGSTITLTGNLVLNTATASSGVFSHYFQVTVNGTLLKIPLYY